MAIYAACLLILAAWIIHAQSDNSEWPRHEKWDLRWLHLHRNHAFLPDAPVNTVAPRLRAGYTVIENPTAETLDAEVRYTIRGIAVSEWIGPPFRFDLRVNDERLEELHDGVHAMTIEARGPDQMLITPIPAFVHLTRDQGTSFGFTTTVPVITAYQMNPSGTFGTGPDIIYIDPADRNHVGYPADPNLTPWSTPPTERTDLFQELMAPHTRLFEAIQMWWDHPAHSDAPFVRGFPPQHGEDHRGLREDHAKFPMMDGQRGVGWMSSYISGQVDSKGRLAFAEVGGRVGYLMPDGEIITLAGWRVKPDQDPIWYEKPLEAVRRNMENRGDWSQESRGEFRTPLDVAIDPRNENILYVAAYEDHVIWKIEVAQDFRRDPSVISILAGTHTPGFVNGKMSEARFNGPASLVFDPIADVLYVADQDNDAIRQVTRDGIVTTVAGGPGMQDRLVSAGVDLFDQLAARSVSRFEILPGETVSPDIYLPQCIRVDSQGRIILLELGYGAVRQINPNTMETKTLGEVQQKHREFSRGWAWLDVDRYGSSGPLDGIYWTKFVNTLEGEFQAEVYHYIAPGGANSVNLFRSPTGLYPDGWGPIETTNPPHYGWLVAVDPRGAVLLAGGGEHGVTRLRLRRDTDPTFSTEKYWLGRIIYNSGVPTDWMGNSDFASRSLALRYGWDGHNMLGLTDLWDLEGSSDEELLDALEVDVLVRSDPTALGDLLAYIRPNTFGAPASAPSVSPPPVSICFSGVTVVETNHGPTMMSKVRVGDYVLTTDGAFELVYSFGHRSNDIMGEFLHFQPSGLELSEDHMIFRAGKVIPAAWVRVGDVLSDGVTVTSIRTVSRRGVYAPFTTSGSIVVNGVKSACYVSLQKSSTLLIGGVDTGISHHWIAHTFEFPHRFACGYLGACRAETYSIDGVSTWVPMSFSKWLLEQPPLLLLLFTIVFLFVGSAFHLLERYYILLLGMVSLFIVYRQRTVKI